MRSQTRSNDKKTTSTPTTTKTRKTSIPKKLSDRNIGYFHKDGSVTTVYVGNLNYRKHENDVKDMFTKFGTVNYVRLVMDRKTHVSKGIAFVQMPFRDQADKAIDAYNGIEINGRTLKCSIAIDSVKKVKAKKPMVVNEEMTTREKEEVKIRVEAAKDRPSPTRRKRDKGLKILFNHLSE